MQDPSKPIIKRQRFTPLPPKRTWIQRNPRLFSATFITTSLLIFFSKPLYDIFIADPVVGPPRKLK